MDAIVVLFFRLSRRAGALSINDVPCETRGGTTSAPKRMTINKTPEKIIATAPVRERPRRRIASTAGLRPVAKKRATKIKTNT